MPRPPRIHVQERPLIEFCNRVAQGCCLLGPDGTFNEEVVGILAKCQELYPMSLHAGSILQNHWHLLGSPDDVAQQAGFIGYFTRQLTLLVQRKNQEWEGRVFPDRYRAMEISTEEEAQAARLKYVLSNSCKEGLVSSPIEWPGVPFAEALVTKERILKGIWIDREALYAARRRGEQVTEMDFAEEVELVLEPLPCWAHLSAVEHRDCVATLIRRIEKESSAMHRVDGTRPAGPVSACRVDPLKRRKLVKQPVQRIYAAARRLWADLKEGMRLIVEAYRSASEMLRSGDRDVIFPPNCFPPALKPVPISGGRLPGMDNDESCVLRRRLRQQV